MNQDARCPIWGTPATEYPTTLGEDRRAFESPRASGWYFITGTAESMLLSRDAPLKARLTTWLIDQRRFGVEHPEVNCDTVKEAEARRPLPIRERADRYLRYLASLEPYPGLSIPVFTPQVGHEDFLAALSWLESSVDPTDADGQMQEVDFFGNYLQQQGWIEFGKGRSDDRLTVAGHVRLAELEAAHTPSTRAFVAMWFDDTMSEAWEQGIAPAVRDTGYEPVRIDRKEHVNKIDDEIVAEIRRARFVVADFTHGDTGVRGGVYYEAGFAHGLGIPVIFSCRKDKLDEVHFDTRQYNHIVWETPGDLRDQLANRIAAVLGDGPNKPQI